MKTTAKDVMKTNFKTLSPDSPISEALDIFKTSTVDGKTIFGIVVTDKDNGERYINRVKGEPCHEKAGDSAWAG